MKKIVELEIDPLKAKGKKCKFNKIKSDFFDILADIIFEKYIKESNRNNYE